VSDFPDVRLKALVTFPATVIGGVGISVVKSGSTYTFKLDHNELNPVSAVASLPTTYVVLFDAVTGLYSRISLTNLKTVLGIP